MKKWLCMILVCMMTLTAPALAYIRRGTVEIEAETSVEVKAGETVSLPVTLTPSQDDQLDGCGMADCPEECGPNCLSKSNDCTCGSTTYETYYATVEIKNDNEAAVSAVYEDGAVLITGQSEGQATLTLKARLREYTGSSIEVAVKVLSADSAPQSGAPMAQSVEITTDNQGEDAQHVNVILTFDGAVDDLKAEDFAVTLAGNPMESENVTLTAEDRAATLTLNTTAIKAGAVEIQYAGDAASPFDVHAVVSPGLRLEVVQQDAEKASVTMGVSELFHVRGIARIMLLENGEPVLTQDEAASEFTGIHGHDFLTLDEAGVVEKLVFGLSEMFPSGYTFVNNGDTITVTKADASEPVELLLAVQESAVIEQK